MPTDLPLPFRRCQESHVHDRAFFVSLRRSRLHILLGLSLLTAGCSSETAPAEKRAAATKHLKYIEELQKKGAATKSSPDKGR
jgi:hypothetical protein